MSYRSRGLRTRRPSSVEGSPTPLPKIATYLHLAAGGRARLAFGCRGVLYRTVQGQLYSVVVVCALCVLSV